MHAFESLHFGRVGELLVMAALANEHLLADRIKHVAPHCPSDSHFKAEFGCETQYSYYRTMYLINIIWQEHNTPPVTRLVLTSTNCPKHTRLGETERTWAKLRISAKVGDLDYDCDYER